MLLPVWSTFWREGRLFQEPSRGKFVLREPYLSNEMQRYSVSNIPGLMVVKLQRSILSINYFGDNSHPAVAARGPVMDSTSAAFFFVGLVFSIFQWRRPGYAIILIWWGVGLQVSVWSPGPPQAHRLVPIIVPLQQPQPLLLFSQLSRCVARVAQCW